MTEVTQAEYEAGGRYNVGRWHYTSKALEFTRDVLPKTCLEIGVGPGGVRLFRESDTMDMEGSPTYRHDAASVPWPMWTDSYDLLIALQVWEHLPSDGQARAFREAMRVSKNIIMSFPLGWNTPDDGIHHQITMEKIAGWTCGVEVLKSELVGVRWPRLVCLWRLR